MTSTQNRPVSAEDYGSMPTVAEYLARDEKKPPPFLVKRSTHDLGNTPIPKERFISQEWADREAERLWKRTWQMACRENDIPNVGDQLAYDILDQSVIVVRVAPDEIKAYHNVCRHRGTRLLDGCTNAGEIRCSFHAWTWSLDGSLQRIPCRWDFPEVEDAAYGLAEVATDRWDGWVFINLDPEAAPLGDHLGDVIPEHFRSWPRSHAWKAAHVAKVVPCNWKVALEAFLEAYHVVQVHPQTLGYVGDCNSQYDFYGPHARFVTAMGVPSPHLGQDVDDQAVVDAMIGDAIADIFGDKADEFQIPQLAPDQGSRSAIAGFVKGALQAQTGIDYSATSDSEVIDAIEYYVFPNLVPWGAHSFPMVYRVRPNGRDPHSCLWEIMVLATMPPEVPLPPDVPMRMTPSDEPWQEARELGGLGPVIDQDMVNLRKVQLGLQSDGYTEVTFSNYQERNIRNFHAHLARLVVP